jgi:hypothetical protein
MAEAAVGLADALAALGRTLRAAARAGDSAQVATLDAARRAILEELAAVDPVSRSAASEALAAEIAADRAALADLTAEMRRMRQSHAARRRYRAGNRASGLATTGQSG